jgi:hypothetical protein
MRKAKITGRYHEGTAIITSLYANFAFISFHRYPSLAGAGLDATIQEQRLINSKESLIHLENHTILTPYLDPRTISQTRSIVKAHVPLSGKSRTFP